MTELQALKQQPSVKFAMTEDIDDSVVKDIFKMLSIRIQQATKQYLSGSPLRKEAAAKRVALFDKITPRWGEGYLKIGPRKSYSIEAIIWHQVVDTLLSRPMKIWCKAAGNTLLNLHKMIWGHKWITQQLHLSYQY